MWRLKLEPGPWSYQRSEGYRLWRQAILSHGQFDQAPGPWFLYFQ